MVKKSYLTFTLTSTLLVLAACSTTRSAEDVAKSTEELHSSFNELVATNHQLHELELEMDKHFETVLAEDEELTSLRDAASPVVQNIDDRKTAIENVDDDLQTFNKQAEALQKYEGTDLPEETVHQISEDFLTFTQEINSYQERYINSLDKQKDYLEQIAADDADYEDFAQGLEAVNEDYRDLQEETYALDQRFGEIDQKISELNKLANKAIAEKTDKSENKTAADVEDTEDAETEESSNQKTASEEAADQTNEAEETDDETESLEPETDFLALNSNRLLAIPNKFPKKFVYDSGVDIPYPEDGVKGVYVTAHSAGGERMAALTDLVNTTDLNAMVIDIKDDYGNITLDLNSDNELVNEMTMDMMDTKEVMTLLDENDIYPIARIVVFKDTLLAKARPELSFTRSDGSVWSNSNGDSFVNPYLKEVWDYNLEVAVQAAKLGFKEIQFDYVRFPEGFENMDRELTYGYGHYGDDDEDVISMKFRNQAVTDFVAYTREHLKPYGADVSVDIFGYAAVVRETEGIGQSFPGIAKEVDVISSMIYPSHWGLGNLDIAVPDLEPYNVVNNYMQIELEILDELGEDAPITRPWLQDFTASYLGAGHYKNYGAQEVSEQVRALADNGVNEFLLWNASNVYSEGATYTFD